MFALVCNIGRLARLMADYLQVFPEQYQVDQLQVYR